jgi:hypothetical protein
MDTRRLLLKPALALTLVFAVCIGLIRLQPAQEDVELRAFLTPPDGCSIPCFMDIRPGVTTMDEALAILEEHEWVGTPFFNTTATPPQSANMSGDILWDWSGLQPSVIDDSFQGRIRIANGKVAVMYIGTHITLGDMWRLLGPPDRGRVARSESDATYRGLQATYLSIPLIVGAEWHCPVNATTFWHAPLFLITTSTFGLDDVFEMEYLHC